MLNIKFNTIYNNIIFKLKQILSFVFNKIIINCSLIVILFVYFCSMTISPYAYYTHNKDIMPFSQDDKKIFIDKLNANGKDILIILDDFNDLVNEISHGKDISYDFNRYIEKELNKEIDILPVYLSFINPYSHNHKKVFLKEKNHNDYLNVVNNHYDLDNYVELLRELNPNSKIVFSLSFVSLLINYKIIELSKKYDIKIVQAYFNNYNFDQWFWLVYFYYFMNKENTIFVTNRTLKPIIKVKHISTNDIDITELREKIIKKSTPEFLSNGEKFIESYARMSYVLNYSSYYTSNLTPILAYEYYLNPNSNIIKK